MRARIYNIYFSSVLLKILFEFHKKQPEWDQVSAYSGRSLGRTNRGYSMENQVIQDDLRSHVSHFSAMAAKGGKSRYDALKKIKKKQNTIIYNILDL